MKLSKAIQLFFLDRKLSFSDETIKTYNYAFQHLITSTNDKDIEQITYSDILEFASYLKDVRKNSNRTIYDNLARISSLWTFFSGEFGIKHIFEKRKPKVVFEESIINPFTEDEVKRLLDACKTKTYIRNGKTIIAKRNTELLDRAIILTLLDSGARVTELCNWLISDYDTKTGKLFIDHAKGNKQRFVIIGNTAQKALLKYLLTRNESNKNAPLFSTRTGTFFDKNNIRHKLDDIALEAKVNDVHPHKFRHTFAINRLRNGDNVFRLKELLGHSNLEMTMKYARIAQIDIDKANECSVADKWKLK